MWPALPSSAGASLLVAVALAGLAAHSQRESDSSAEGAGDGVSSLVRLAFASGAGPQTTDGLAARLRAIVRKNGALTLGLPTHEQLVAVDPEGVILARLEGTETSTRRALLAVAFRVTLPGNRALSPCVQPRY